MPKAIISEQENRIREVQEQFISEWGRMSSAWGINRTMAQIHALLFITGRPHSMDEIIARLHISRGNASMNLHDLMDWAIVKRKRQKGERKDLYYSESDPWQMFAKVVRERKRREVDPTEKAIEECLLKLPNSGVEEEIILKARLEGLREVFGIVDVIYEQVFKTDETFYQTLKLFGRKD